jgi:RNA polymerase sigma factor for flagellar operon FliA
MAPTGTDRLQTVEELWADFKSTADQSARDRLILHYSPLVKYVAGRVAAAMPSHVDYSDLVSYGILGLIDAIEKFDPSRAIKFETYGVPRVRGAILDELRSIDWVPRSVRAKARAVDSALSKLEGQLGRSPTDRELADEMEMTTSDLDDILRQTSRAGLLQLDDVRVEAEARLWATLCRTKGMLPVRRSSSKRPGDNSRKRSNGWMIVSAKCSPCTTTRV